MEDFEAEAWAFGDMYKLPFPLVEYLCIKQSPQIGIRYLCKFKSRIPYL